MPKFMINLCDNNNGEIYTADDRLRHIRQLKQFEAEITGDSGQLRLI